MAFNKQYYEDKKQKLIAKNQQLTQKFLADTLTFAKDISEIDNDFREIQLYETELSKEKPVEEVKQIIKKK